MPAIERPFSAPLPPSIYLDTDVLIATLFTAEPHHNRCRSLIKRLIDAGTTRVVLSSFSWMEFVHVVMLERFRTRLPDDLRQHFRLDRWAMPDVRGAYVQSYLDGVAAILAPLPLVEVPLTPDIRAGAIEYAVRYNLGSQDAVHVASATFGGVVDMASFDARFRRVEGLTLWNDGIHAATA